jgi:ATP-dependent helicase HrpA
VAKIPATDAFGAAGTVAQRIVDQVAHNLLARDVHTQSAFMAMLADGGSRLQAQTLALATACLPVIEAYAELWRDLEKTARGHGGDSQAQSLAATLSDEMRRLVPPNFIALYAPERFTDLVRYLQAARIRLQRGIVDPERERRYAAALTPYLQKLNALLEELTPLSSPAKRAALEELFWMIEEYKVSLFAQELKTRVPVSPKRLDKQINQVGQLE